MKRPESRIAVLTALLGGLAASCGDGAGTAGAVDAYLRDPSYRRAELTASLVNPENTYSQLRLAHYDSGDVADWSRLPEWNPRVEIVAARELDAPGGVVAGASLTPDARSLTVDDGAARGEEASLVALGREAFFRYPVQLAFAAGAATVSRQTFARYGFWTDETLGAGGLVRAELGSGERALAYTCATCHAGLRDGALVVGVGNDRLDLGRLFVDAASNVDSGLAVRYLGWGPGRLDVTTLEGTEPVRLPDLRPVRWLTHLQADATVAQRDRTMLAIRLETLIITSHDEVIRPPRAVTLGLAAYLASLADELPEQAPASDAEGRGAAVFQATCAACHVPPALTGPPVALAVVGTDPLVGLSLDRGTGTYRVPSLHGVGTRGPLLHDASLPGLDAMFDPARTSPAYTGGRHGPGAVAGHPFGLDLDAASRADLVAYLALL